MSLKGFIGVENGGDAIFDSITLTGVDNSYLATDGDGLFYGVPAVTSGDVSRASGTGTTDFYSIAWNGTRFVAVGESGGIYTSTTGTGTWTRRTSPTAQILLAVAWSGIQFCSVGVAGAIITSPDGITWTLQTSGSANNLAAVTWDATNSQFVVVGSTQTVLTSPDGVTWTTRTYGTTTTIRGVAAGTSIIVAVGVSGGIKTSPTGVTWTTRTSGVATELYNVIWDATNSRFVAVGASGVILTSSDGATWAPQTSGIATFIRNVSWNATAAAYRAVGDGGVILGSTNSTAWSVKTSGTTVALESVVSSGTLWVAVGMDGTRLTSSDGDTWTTLVNLLWSSSTPTGTGLIVAANSPTMTALTLSDLTASKPVSTDASKKLITSPTTGSGSTVVLGTSPIISSDLTVSGSSPVLFLRDTAETAGHTQTLVFGTPTFNTATVKNTTIGTSGTGQITISMALNNSFRDVITLNADQTVQALGAISAPAPFINTVGNQTFNNAAVSVASTTQTVQQTGTMSASRIATLPAASTVLAGRVITIVDVSGTAGITNTIVVTAAGSDTINGAATSTIVTAYGSRAVMSDGISKWTIVSLL